MGWFGVPSTMPERCRACNHPNIDEINSHLIKGNMSMRAIAEKYGTPETPLSYSGLRHHKAKHLQEIINQVQKERKETTKGEVYSTLDAYNKIISRLDSVIDSASLSLIVKALEGRSRLLGEERQPPRIIIEWGLGIDTLKLKQLEGRYKIIPAEQLPAPELDLVDPKDFEDEPE